MRGDRRPPADLSPALFFEQWLPAELERLGAASMSDTVVRVRLTGQDGGSWDLVVRRGRLQVFPADEEEREARVSLLMTVRDWCAIVLGEAGPVDLSPPGTSPTDLLFVDAASQEMLRSVTGVFRFEVREYNGRTWMLQATFGQVEARMEPDALIATDAATYGAILARELSAPEAYLDRKILVSGDIARGMQVGMALMPRF